MTGEYYVAIDEREKLNKGNIDNGTFIVGKEMLVLEFSHENGSDPRALVINERNDFQWVDLVRLRHIRNIPLSTLLKKQISGEQITLEQEIAGLQALIQAELQVVPVPEIDAPKKGK